MEVLAILMGEIGYTILTISSILMQLPSKK